MANCHELFLEFNKSITLTESKKNYLRKSRVFLRNKIKDYIKECKPEELQPKFYGQGSFAMNTIINPIVAEEKKYDLDDGVYFIGKSDNQKEVHTYHQWIYDAVKEHTDNVIDKNTCVRVTYSDGHHIDIPIYFKDKEDDDSIPQLAHKKNSWIDSDPKAFVEWFNENKIDQSVRLVKYFKAWADYNKNIMVPSGIILTILLINNYCSAKDRDDEAFLESISAIKESLDDSFSCYRPTPDESEDLLQKHSTDKIKSSFLNGLQNLINSGNEAIEQKNPKDACKIWQKQFGRRFSCINAKDELSDAVSHASPAVINTSAKSA